MNTTWLVWGLILIAQNISFTFVSRARNSGSLSRHMTASLLSNGIWFASQAILVTEIFEMIRGSMGWWLAIEAGVFYTLMTMLGAAIGHKVCMVTEKGKSAVGASDKYAQITKVEWETVLSETLRSIASRKQER